MKEKVNIFETLAAIDKRDFDYYNHLTDDEKKSFVPTVVLRWASGIKNGSEGELSLYLINEYANFDWFSISNHPELQYKLLCSSGLGYRQKHSWLAPPKQNRITNKLHDFLLQYYPNANDLELNIIQKSFSKETFRNFLHECGIDEKEERKWIECFERETII